MSEERMRVDLTQHTLGEIGVIKIQVSIMLLVCMLISLPIDASSVFCDASVQNPCIVQDTVEHLFIIKNWRDTHMMLKAYKGNTAGLDNLWMSGSGAPSVAGFQLIKNKIQQMTGGSVGAVIDLDLRQESHGYINDEAMTLTAINDWGNSGKTNQQALAAEQDWLHRIQKEGLITQVLTPKQFKAGEYTQGKLVRIHALATEQKIAELTGMQYVRLMVTDHMAPGDADVDAFVELIRNLPTNAWLHIHCRGGDGRTTTFMVMYDMLNNADTVTFDEILKRQASVRPYYDLYYIDRSTSERNAYYKKRLEFLKQFYLFAQAYLKGYPETWSVWKKGVR